MHSLASFISRHSILSTADYCVELTTQLQGKLQDKVDKDVKAAIDLHEEVDCFNEACVEECFSCAIPQSLHPLPLCIYFYPSIYLLLSLILSSACFISFSSFFFFLSLSPSDFFSILYAFLCFHFLRALILSPFDYVFTLDFFFIDCLPYHVISILLGDPKFDWPAGAVFRVPM